MCVRESRGDRKIGAGKRGGGKYSNHRRHHRHGRPEHPWSTSHSENTTEAHPGASLHCRSSGRKKAGTPGKVEKEGRTMSVWWLGRVGNLIANTFHSPANFKPISSVYCQSQRARNSSLSVRNEILPVVPFRRSPCPFDLHWQRLGNLSDTSRTRVAILKREHFVQRRPRDLRWPGNRPTFRYLSVSTRFKYFAINDIRADFIESDQFADAFYVFIVLIRRKG